MQIVREVGKLLRILAKKPGPAVTQIAPALADALTKMFPHALWHQELRVFRPTIEPLDQPDFVLPQSLTVRRVRVLFVRRPITDVAIHDDESGLVSRVEKNV